MPKKKPCARDLKAEETAKKKLLAFLNKALRCDGDWQSYIETWADGPWGLRIAEIGIHSKIRMAGATHFRNEAGNALLFLRCEDLLAQWAYNVGAPGDVDEFKQQITDWMKLKFVVLSKKKGQPWIAHPGVWGTIGAANHAIEGHRESVDMKGAKFCVRRMEEVS